MFGLKQIDVATNVCVLAILQITCVRSNLDQIRVTAMLASQISSDVAKMTLR